MGFHNNFSSEINAKVSYQWQGSWLLSITILSLTCFFWLPESYVRMIGWPWLLVWQLGFLAASVLGLWMLRQVEIPFKTLGYGLDWALGFILLSTALSTAFAPFPQIAIWYTLMATGYGLSLYVGHNWLNNQRFRTEQVWLGIVLVGAITNIISLTMWQPNLNMWTSDAFNDALRNPWPLGQHNFVGGYEVLLLPITLSYTLAHKNWQRVIGVIATILSAVSLYASGSRGALLGAVTMVVIFGLLMLWKNRPQPRWLTLSSTGLTLVVAVFVLISNPRIRTIFTLLSPANRLSGIAWTSLLSDGPIRDRVWMLKAAENILKDRPLVGVGPGNMARVFSLYRPIDTGDSLETIQQLHNTPAQLFGELGVIGIVACLSLLLCLGWLGFKVSRQPLENADEWLLIGSSVSLVAYGISSLTDYQLENIAISTLLLINILFILSLTNRYELQHLPLPITLSRHLRQLISLGILIFLGLTVRIWLPVDMAAYQGQAAYQAMVDKNPIAADTYWDKASRLQPWDPIYSSIAAQQLLKLADFAEAHDRQPLLTQAANYYRRSTDAAPNDGRFNQNLAVLLLDSQPEQAAQYAGKAAQLLPRGDNYTYYLLGLTYLAQADTEKATQALILETLVNPKFLTLNLWEKPALASLKPQVLSQSLTLFEELLAALDPISPLYQSVYGQSILLRWWHHIPLPSSLQTKSLRPIVRSLLSAEASPKVALQILNQEINVGNSEQGLWLLRAWLEPDTYLSSYLKQFAVSEKDVTVVTQHIQENRDLRSWLSSIPVSEIVSVRAALRFTYRNRYSDLANLLLQPKDIQVGAIADLLNLFQKLPRTAPQLDQLLNRYRSQTLNLPHPTQTQFRLQPIPEGL